MSYNKVMEEYYRYLLVKPDTLMEWFWFIICCILVMIVLYVIVKKVLKKWYKKADKATERFIFANVVVCTIGILSCIQMYEMKIWSDKYAVKYIESLPDKEMRVEKVVWDTSDKIDKYDVEVEGNFTKDFIKDKNDVITVKVYGKKGKLEIIKYLDVVKKESKDGKTYLRYKYLNRDLPMFEKGIYNVVLYVPEN